MTHTADVITYSPFIWRMRQTLRAMGWCVWPAPNLPANIAGRTYYRTRVIEINCADARSAMITLAHEFGHALDARNPQSMDERTRERKAYLYGWAVVRWFQLPVTRAEWRAHHAQLLEECR